MSLVPPFVPPVDALNRGHATLWGNLGDWSEASGYVAAAEALALRLGQAAGLRAGQRILDVGCGAGDQLRLWTETFGIRHVTGVEKNASLAARARRRVAEWGLEDRVQVLAGKASRARWTDAAVDGVLALDSAYFFDSRAAFMGRCRSTLRPGGVLALTDLLAGNGPSAGMARGMASLFGVPRQSLLTERHYRAALAENGFEDVSIEDRTEDVLVGFARWTRAGGHRWSARSGSPGLWPTRLGLSATGWMAGFLARSASLRYVLVTARKRHA